VVPFYSPGVMSRGSGEGRRQRLVVELHQSLVHRLRKAEREQEAGEVVGRRCHFAGVEGRGSRGRRRQPGKWAELGQLRPSRPGASWAAR
jgi:hypothetical protein